jgi:hypothetical protein
VAYNDQGQIVDFGTLEVQAVYISGNIRQPFERYMQDPKKLEAFDWSNQRFYPRPDYLSSSRKRLAPQLIYKGGILQSWGKKQAIALHSGFFETLPSLTEVSPDNADMAWLVYDLILDSAQQRYHLTLSKTIYTLFKPALDKITTPEPGPIETFMGHLQNKLDEKLENGNPPDAPTLTDILSS